MSVALAVHHGAFGRVAVYRLDRSMVMHAHREGHLIFHVEGPAASITVDGRLHALAPGRAVAVSPWQPHNYQSDDPRSPSVFLVLYIRPVWFLEASRRARWALRFGRTAVEVSEPIGRLIHQVATRMMQQTEEHLLPGYLFELTQECFDQSWQWMPDGPAGLKTARTAPDFRVRNSMQLMRQRIGDDVALDRIARDAGLSRPHFYKLFREQVGVTPNIYLNTLRMEHAIARLTTTGDAVTNIGIDLGFSSQASFTRFFICNVGIPPSDYRRAAHQAAPALH